MRAAPDWLPQILLCIQRKQRAHVGFSQLDYRLKGPPPPRGLDGALQVKENSSLAGGLLQPKPPQSRWHERTNVAQDWKHLLPRVSLRLPPARAHTGNNIMVQSQVSHREKQSRFEHAGYEQKPIRKRLPMGDKFRTFVMYLGKRWSISAFWFSLKKLAFEILPVRFKVQKCPMVEIPMFSEMLFFLIQHSQYC